MIKQTLKKGTAKLLVATLGLSLFLTGCGDKKEDFSDYGTLSGSADSSGKAAEGDGSKDGSGESSETKKTSDDASSASSTTEGTLLQKLGLKDSQVEHSSSFTAAGKSVGLEFKTVLEDTDSLPTYKVTEITEADVHEDEIVENIFGDTAVPLNTDDRKFINDSLGDSGFLVSCCSSVSYMNGAESSWNSAKAWQDEDNFYIHVYEGTYNGILSQLMISYSKQTHEKVVALYPKDLADISGDPNLNLLNASDPDGKLYIYDNGLKTFDLNAIMADSPNVCQLSDDELSAVVVNTLHDKLFIDIPKEGLNFAASMYDEYMPTRSEEEKEAGLKSEIVFYNENEVSDSSLPGAVRNGYLATYSGTIGNQPIVDNSIVLDYLSGESVSSLFLVNDSGMFGFQITASYNFHEMVSENVSLLSFEDGMKAFETAMTDNLDLSHASDLSADQPCFNTMRLMYCPVPTDETKKEFYLVPAWVADIDKAGSIKVRAMVSAVDGELINIVYR